MQWALRQKDTGLLWELGKSGLRLYLLEAHRKAVIWLSALVLVLELLLGLLTIPFWGCVPAQKQPVLCTSLSLPSRVQQGQCWHRPLGRTSQCPSSKTGCSSDAPRTWILHLRGSGGIFEEAGNCYGLPIPALLASVGVCAMGVLHPCVQGRVTEKRGRHLAL